MMQNGRINDLFSSMSVRLVGLGDPNIVCFQHRRSGILNLFFHDSHQVGDRWRPDFPLIGFKPKDRNLL